jgi:hypothetical protein
MKRENFKWRKELRREEAEERKVARSKRSTEKQIALIKTRRGNSKKELTRLQELISTK